MTLHFMPTYSSWLNQVEIWFGKLSATSSPGASSLPSRTSVARSCATSGYTVRPPKPFGGNMLIHPAAFFRGKDPWRTAH
ncbi:MAG: transposase [Bryobacterales bacterium]|nr:transposase [Bryobacterales bacterium]